MVVQILRHCLLGATFCYDGACTCARNTMLPRIASRDVLFMSLTFVCDAYCYDSVTLAATWSQVQTATRLVDMSQ